MCHCWTFHINRTMQYVAFHAWLLSLSCIHHVACIRNPLTVMAESFILFEYKIKNTLRVKLCFNGTSIRPTHWKKLKMEILWNDNRWEASANWIMKSLGKVANNYLLYIKSLLNKDSGDCLFLAGNLNEAERNNCPSKHILKGFYLFLIDEWE